MRRDDDGLHNGKPARLRPRSRKRRNIFWAWPCAARGTTARSGACIRDVGTAGAFRSVADAFMAAAAAGDAMTTARMLSPSVAAKAGQAGVDRFLAGEVLPFFAQFKEMAEASRSRARRGDRVRLLHVHGVEGRRAAPVRDLRRRGGRRAGGGQRAGRSSRRGATLHPSGCQLEAPRFQRMKERAPPAAPLLLTPPAPGIAPAAAAATPPRPAPG